MHYLMTKRGHGIINYIPSYLHILFLLIILGLYILTKSKDTSTNTLFLLIRPKIDTMQFTSEEAYSRLISHNMTVPQRIKVKKRLLEYVPSLIIIFVYYFVSIGYRRHCR